jgi:hypothetical protein
MFDLKKIRIRITTFTVALAIGLTGLAIPGQAAADAPFIPICTFLDTSPCLIAITIMTYNVLDRLNTGSDKTIGQLVNYLNNSLTKADESQETANFQAQFTALNNYYKTLNANSVTNNERQLIANMYTSSKNKVSIDDFFRINGKEPNIYNLYNSEKTPINDLSYLTMLKVATVEEPKFQENIAAHMINYISFASGLANHHVEPSTNWKQNTDQAKQANEEYLSYYNTVLAIESFNSYILGSQFLRGYAGTNEAQQELLTQASAGNWFAKVAGEEIGVVLRQLLMFESQNYVMLSELVQIQQKTLTALIMTNSLLVTGNKGAEAILLQNAKGEFRKG